jgi:hypothetical protein
MRYLLAILLLGVALSLAAQTKGKPNLQPIPEPPPPPPGYQLDPALEPQVTIRRQGLDTVEEFRIGGKLYMIKVTPSSGRPYYMIDHQGDGRFSRQDTDVGIRPPMWVIHQF